MKLRRTPGRLYVERDIMRQVRVGMEALRVPILGWFYVGTYEPQPRLKVTCITWRGRPFWKSYITERDS